MSSEQKFSEQLLASARGHFTWPDDAMLYHLPPERELLPEKVQRLIIQCYLQLSGLPYTNRVVLNADYMSPSGVSPFLCLKLGSQPMLFSDFEKLVAFLEAQNLGLRAELEPAEKSDKEAYISLLRTKFTPAEEYQTWVNTKNVEYARRIHGYGFPWPLSKLIPRLQQWRFCWNHWDLFRAPQDEIVLDFEQACSILSERLGKSEMFFSSGLTTLDAVVYGHLRALMSTALPSSDLARIVLRFKNLDDFCRVTLPARGVRLAGEDSGSL